MYAIAAGDDVLPSPSGCGYGRGRLCYTKTNTHPPPLHLSLVPNTEHEIRRERRQKKGKIFFLLVFFGGKARDWFDLITATRGRGNFSWKKLLQINKDATTLD
jgi:hypothetical protein